MNRCIDSGSSSDAPHCALDSTGKPLANASMMTLPNGSNSDGSANASAA